jgi:glutamyl-tRNA synthetase
MNEPRGRYAPSPTGELHLGNASTALMAWLSVRARGGRFVMRVEDLDRARSREELVERILADLAWLGLDWDEGPDRGGPHGPYAQSSRLERYAQAFARLEREGRVYPCFCSRRDVAAAASAPQMPGDEIRYPGTCRDLDPRQARRRIERGERHAFRFRVPASARPRFDDLVRGPVEEESPPGDFVVSRADGVPSYQLAVVVDDAAMGIDEVVRGDDLLPSTGRQLLLFEALELPEPRFGHVPLLLGPDGVRLSKRHRDLTIRELRESGRSAESIVGAIAALLGLYPGREPVPAADLVEGFELGRIPAAPRGIVARIDPRDPTGHVGLPDTGRR